MVFKQVPRVVFIAAYTAAAAFGSNTACSSSESSSTAPDTTDRIPLPGAFPENRGQQLPVTDITGNVGIRWGGATDIVYYTVAITQQITEVRSLRISDQTTRVLHRGGNVGYSGYNDIEISPDGLHVFAMLDKALTGDVDVLDVSDGTSRLIAQSPRSQPAIVEAGFEKLLPSPDSKGVVYEIGVDSLRFYDASTHSSRRLGEGCNVPVVFSPDGQSLLCSSKTLFQMMSVPTGIVRSVTLPLPGQVFTNQFSWTDNGLEVLSAGVDGRLILTNGTTGASTVLLNPSQIRFDEHVDFLTLTRSADGKKVAFASHRPITLLGSSTELVLYVVDIASLRLDHVAVLKQPIVDNVFPAISSIQFSPDGRSVAFVVGTPRTGSVFLAAVPQ